MASGARVPDPARVMPRAEERGQRVFAWVTLDPSDSDPIRFWTYPVEAVRAVAPEVGLSLAAAPSARAPDWPPGVSRRSATLRPQRSFNRRSLIPWFAVVSTAVTVCQPNAR